MRKSRHKLFVFQFLCSSFNKYVRDDVLIQGLIFEGLTDKPTNGACHALQDHLFHCNKKVLLNVVYILVEEVLDLFMQIICIANL